MKLIIAHLPDDAFASVRSELLDIGVFRMTISQVHSSGSQSTMTLRCGAGALRTHLRSELRLECVATAGQSPAVAGVLRGHADARLNRGGRVMVLDLEELHAPAPEDQILPDDPRSDTIRPAGC